MEVVLESALKTDSHIIMTTVRLPPDLYDYTRTRLELQSVPQQVGVTLGRLPQA